MSQYEMQRYFKDKCSAFYTAYREAKRLSSLEQKCAKQKFACADWIRRTDEELKEITRLIEDFNFYKIPIIVTEKAEVIALLSFFGNHSVEKWDILYTPVQYLKGFPQDELSQNFLHAYLNKDQKKMIELLKHAVKT